jgi:hypothetical protein
MARKTRTVTFSVPAAATEKLVSMAPAEAPIEEVQVAPAVVETVEEVQPEIESVEGTEVLEPNEISYDELLASLSGAPITDIVPDLPVVEGVVEPDAPTAQGMLIINNVIDEAEAKVLNALAKGISAEETDEGIFFIYAEQEWKKSEIKRLGRMVKLGYVVHVGFGQFELTELGLLENFANTWDDLKAELFPAIAGELHAENVEEATIEEVA